MRAGLFSLLFGLLTVTVQAGNFGSSIRNTDLRPAYVTLAHGNDSFKGKVVDESTRYEVKDLSFGGVTKIGNALKKDDDSSTNLELEVVKKIVVLDGSFESLDSRHRFSPNYPLFVEARVHFFTGKEEIFMLPYDLTICGVDATSGAGKAWFLRDINFLENLGKFRESPDVKSAPHLIREEEVAKVAEKPSEKYRSMFGRLWDWGSELFSGQ